ncbi:hypothetical protein [Alistipes sp. CHKCI003]|uniref:hypothetical protein n=1 Tax=Alistipes sp. CHKCI003 TaxID=1780376 RepID=UPI000A7E427B|nr:hypothetical protein [Alistipes sp. CHKCI003]
MPEWDLTKKQIYKLLKHPFQKEKSVIEEITSAYLEFVEDLFDHRNREHDNKIRIKQLNMSYIDFGTIKALEETSPTENSKLKIIYLDKLLSLLHTEQEPIYRRMEYPKFSSI